MANSSCLEKIFKTGIRKVLNLLKSIAINKSPEDLEFLIAWWSTESQTFVTAWGEFYFTLEDVVVLIGLSLFEETRAVKLPEEAKKLL